MCNYVSSPKTINIKGVIQNLSLQALADTIQSFKHWMCLHFEDSTLAPYSCFVLRYPPTPFILLAGVKKKHIKCIMEVHVHTFTSPKYNTSIYLYKQEAVVPLFLMQALSLTLECAGWSETELSGRSLDSLLDLLTNQYSQVLFHLVY